MRARPDLSWGSAVMPTDFLPWVNLLQGTNSTHDFSRGNTLPLIARPWGLHHWTLQTAKTPWTFHPSHRKLQGIRLTHQPSPWIADYGGITVLPFTGEATGELEQQASAYRLETTLLRPTLLRTELLRYGIAVEMTPTVRGALFVFTRQSSSEALRVRFHFDGGYALRWERGSRRLVGASHHHNGGVAGAFGLHLCAEFDTVPERFDSKAHGGSVTFPRDVARVEMRLAGSFIGPEIAEVSLERELRGRDLDTLTREGDSVWNDLLGRIQFDVRDERQARTFYSCLYRTLLFPRFLDEIDARGRVVHYSPYDGLTHAGSLCADHGFWDAYRTNYPLLALAYPDELRAMLGGWLNACREGGWTPKWVSPGHRACMIGTHFAAVAAEAVARGIADWGVEEVYEYLWRDASESSSKATVGRQGLKEYIRLGYVPCDKYPYGVSATLDFAYGDFCVAQVARHLGRHGEADLLLKRARSYRHLFDPAVGFMRGRKASGEWASPFEEFRWGGAYIEGGPWQHVFNVPHDVPGLASLFGGDAGLCRKLDAMLATPARFSIGSYPAEIHEMTEMALAGFGQYAHSNQPVHGFLFLYQLAGQPEKTAYWVRRVAQELYSPDDFPGDEDNGEMSAWYVFACLGLYPACPGTDRYVAFPPLVSGATINGVPVMETRAVANSR